MPRPSRLGAAMACALSICLPAGPSGAEGDPLAWRQAPDMTALAGHLDLWLDGAADLPRAPAPPDIRIVAPAGVPGWLEPRAAGHGETTRGLYDPETGTIYLIRPWDPRDPRDAGVLLHELVHHRQATHGHWYCPGAQELPAYRLQEAWLAELGLTADINWIAVVLEAGCTPRDIHPD